MAVSFSFAGDTELNHTRPLRPGRGKDGTEVQIVGKDGVTLTSRPFANLFVRRRWWTDV